MPREKGAVEDIQICEVTCVARGREARRGAIVDEGIEGLEMRDMTMEAMDWPMGLEMAQK